LRHRPWDLSRQSDLIPLPWDYLVITRQGLRLPCNLEFSVRLPVLKHLIYPWSHKLHRLIRIALTTLHYLQ